jgi:hypothetical protein
VSIFFHLPRLIPILKTIRLIPLWNVLLQSGQYFASFKYCFAWLGLFPIVAFICPLFVCRSNEFELMLTAILTFCVSANISVLPKQFDCLTAHFGVLPIGCVFFFVFIHRMAAHRSLPEEVRGFLAGAGFVLFVCSVGSAVAGFWRQIPRAESPWNDDQVLIAVWIQKNTARKAVFAGNEAEMWAVNALAGRIAFVAPKATAEVIGIDREGLRKKLNDWCGIDQNRELFEGVDYFLMNDKNNEKPCGAVNLESSRWKEVFMVGSYRLYEQIGK